MSVSKSIPCICIDIITITISGWWLSHPSENLSSAVWMMIIPNILKNKIHVPVTTNQILNQWQAVNHILFMGKLTIYIDTINDNFP